jgi:hypothetical protein
MKDARPLDNDRAQQSNGRLGEIFMLESRAISFGYSKIITTPLLAFPAFARAQTSSRGGASPDGAVVAANDEQNALQDIVRTAQSRSRRLQDVAGAVGALGGRYRLARQPRVRAAGEALHRHVYDGRARLMSKSTGSLAVNADYPILPRDRLTSSVDAVAPAPRLPRTTIPTCTRKAMPGSTLASRSPWSTSASSAGISRTSSSRR